MIMVADQLGRWMGIKASSVWGDSSLMIEQPDWMLWDFLVISSHSQASFTSGEGHNKQGQDFLCGFYVAQYNEKTR